MSRRSSNINQTDDTNLVLDDESEEDSFHDEMILPQVKVSGFATTGRSQITAKLLDSLEIMIQKIKKELQELVKAMVSIYAF